MNAIEAMKAAKPGGLVQAADDKIYRVNETGDDLVVNMDHGGSVWLTMGAVLADVWTVVRVGPEKPKAEPYKTPFVASNLGSGEDWYLRESRGATESSCIIDTAPGTKEQLQRIVARLNATVDAAYGRGKSEALTESERKLLEATKERIGETTGQWTVDNSWHVGAKLAEAMNEYRKAVQRDG